MACSERHLSVGERRITQQLVEQVARRRIQRLPGESDEHGALAFAKVIARGLAGDGGVAEDAEHVVAELERHAERMTESTQGCELVGVGAGEGRPQEQRLLDAVSGRFQ